MPTCGSVGASAIAGIERKKTQHSRPRSLPRFVACSLGFPADRANSIAEHAGRRGSGRVGRSAAGRALDEEAVTLAVVASVRHTDTGYDELLMGGMARDEARERVEAEIARLLHRWRSEA